jgi:hypothetical protein
MDAMQSTDEKRQNRRTALVLATIAFAFFAGVILRQWLLQL